MGVHWSLQRAEVVVPPPRPKALVDGDLEDEASNDGGLRSVTPLLDAEDAQVPDVSIM